VGDGDWVDCVDGGLLIMWLGNWFMGFGKLYKFLIAGTGLEIADHDPDRCHVRKRTS